MKKIYALIALLVAIPLGVAYAAAFGTSETQNLRNFTTNSSSEPSNCSLSKGKPCYYYILSTDTVAGDASDSVLYNVEKCTDGVAYWVTSDGTGTVQPWACPGNTKASGCAMWTPDTDGDGVADNLLLNGNAGQIGFPRQGRMIPDTIWHYIDVTVAPGSGYTQVQIKCQ